MPARLRRSLLFTPGDRPDRFSKAVATGEADSLVVDWEDAVAPATKASARALTSAAFPGLARSRTERVIRVNGLSTPWYAEDVAAAGALAPDAILLPKTESAEDARRVSRDLAALEASRGLPAASIRLLLLVESPRGVLAAPELAACDARVDALVWGADDYQAAVGGRRRRDNLDVLQARSLVVLAAASAGIPAIDQVFTDIEDVGGLETDAAFARDLGFQGKIVIHPKQVPVVNRVFAPTEREIAQASRLVEAAEGAEREGKGAFAFEGRMVDRPIVEQARRVLDRAAAAGLARPKA